MGKIEVAIMDNYRQALNDGNLSQASKAVKLAQKLKSLMEQESFVDYDGNFQEAIRTPGSVFKPYPYRYNKEKGYITILDSPVILTKTENRFFELLSQNETYEDQINIITKDRIKEYVWPDEHISDNAVRVLIKRVRTKFELIPHKPQVLINFNSKGYVFMAKQLK